ncbi:MAG TPA: zinc-dependent metalloprotease [Chitinophagaceae bacterium]|jgi:predicted Zn-dependent protease|nr:zinc-dependent metalloprotease [Chitinophagaceae bacterium]
MKRKILPLAAGILLLSCSVSQRNLKPVVVTTPPASIKTDSAKKPIRPYKDVITDKAITQNGLFKVHKIEDRYFFEIPDSLFGRDMLVVSRISKAATLAGTAGDAIGEYVIRFTRDINSKVFLRRISFLMQTKDAEGGIQEALEKSNVQPITAAFDIKTFSSDSAAVIDITDFINSDNQLLTFSGLSKTAFQIDAYHADKSYIIGIKAFPMNIEIKTVRTFTRSKQPATYEMNNSIVLLSDNNLMKPRVMDNRVGYFARGHYDFTGDRPVNEERFITRWRLEPKEEDIARYKAGILVEPKKPIVFYIDPATPKKWIPYLMQGVSDWQKAFEKAGFKNAIYAKEALVNDSSWSLEDARYSAIVYKATPIQNARGPQVSDPRTGEILESHIDWYHNIQQLLHNWYLVQASPNDPRASKMEYDDALMGRLIRYVCAHEVGHTLGLTHNFGSSSLVPVDSLRSKTYVKANGICPSIMDYARFNYVAQPEDGLDPESLISRIGRYDEWAIEWGYRWFDEFKSAKDEKDHLRNWISAEVQKDNRLWYTSQWEYPLRYNWDFKRQIEDLGDNSMKASYYGIQNLKRIVPKLQEWIMPAEHDYEMWKDVYNEVKSQYINYLFHVANNIGGVTWIGKYTKSDIEGIAFADAERQKAAVQFLQDELFTTPRWLFDENTFNKTIGMGINNANIAPMYKLINIQGEVLVRITTHATYSRLLLAQTTSKGKSYSVQQLLDALRSGIWKELKSHGAIDIYRRNLQKLYADRFIRQLSYRDKSLLLHFEDEMFFAFENTFSDVLPIVKNHLAELAADIDKALPGYKDKETIIHLKDIRDRIRYSLHNSKDGLNKDKDAIPMQSDQFSAYRNEKAKKEQPVGSSLNCWGDNY